MKKIRIGFALLVILVNLPPFKLHSEEDMLYSNGNGTFTFDEVNYTGRNYKLCLINFQAYKASHTKDTVLYRLIPINILEFWRWGDYLLKKKYKLPYRSWDKIETMRGPLELKSNWQDF